MGLRVLVNVPFGRMVCPEGWRRSRENSPGDFQLWIVWQGAGWLKSSEQEFELRPGFCVILGPGSVCEVRQDSQNPLGMTYIHFEMASVEIGASPPPASALAPECYQREDIGYLDAATRRIIQLAGTAPEVASQLLSTLLEDLRQEPRLKKDDATISRYETHDRRIRQMKADIQTSTEPLPEVSKLADWMGMTLEHFSRVFHQLTGQSAKDFLLGCRISRARHLLSETELSMTQIAAYLDYADVYFFSRQFKQKTGLTPSAYRSGFRSPTPAKT